MNYKIVTPVHRVTKKSVKPLKYAMIIFALLFLALGILANRGMFLPCFFMAALYFYFDANSTRDYEYTYEDHKLTIDVIKGRNRRTTAHVLNMDELVIVAPHDAPEVARYRKNAEEGNLKKFDYTSYDDNIPYYTMIIYENKDKIKLLLDLKSDMLHQMFVEYPQKVII